MNNKQKFQRSITPAEQELGAFKLNNIQSSDELLKNRRKQQIIKYRQLVDQISFVKHRPVWNNYDNIKPLLFFFKFLALRPEEIQYAEDQAKRKVGNERLVKSMKLKLWLPDTIVYGDAGIQKAWYYTAEDGYVYRTDNFNPRQVVAKLGNYSSVDELVAVLKKPQHHSKLREICGNEVKLVTTRDLSQITPTLNNARNQVLQKYVKSCGPKAFICRTHWIAGASQNETKPRSKSGKKEF